MKKNEIIEIKVLKSKGMSHALAAVNFKLKAADSRADFALRECVADDKHVVFRYICLGPCNRHLEV